MVLVLSLFPIHFGLLFVVKWCRKIDVDSIHIFFFRTRTKNAYMVDLLVITMENERKYILNQKRCLWWHSVLLYTQTIWTLFVSFFFFFHSLALAYLTTVLLHRSIKDMYICEQCSPIATTPTYTHTHKSKHFQPALHATQ